jgi:hypothetical protein
MIAQHEETLALPTGTTIGRFNRVPIVVKPDFWPIPILVTGFLVWVAGLRHPELSRPRRLQLALFAMPVALFADIGHALAHTVSARLAGAPMDEILLSSGMPRTLYQNNDVAPRIHILRSLGGPIFSLAGFTLSLLGWRFWPGRSIGRDLAGLSLASHSVILFGSLAPLPMVDGGVILKWKLIEAGQSPEQADQTVRRTSLGLGVAFLALGALFAFGRKRRLVGGLLAGSGAAVVAAGAVWLK